MEIIKKIVTEKEMIKIDRVLDEVYSIDDGSNHSVAFQLGFDTVSNLNGNGYHNLVLIADSLNSSGEDEAFARFILSKAIDGEKIEALKKELGENRNQYISFLYL